MESEIRKTFHQQLDELYLDLLRMSNRCQEMIEETRQCFASLDMAAADRIISDDDIIDDFRELVEENGFELIARQAPVAVDLRNIIVIMRLAQHLERVGDLCGNIAKATRNLEGHSIAPWIKEKMDVMFRCANDLLGKAMDAFKARDLDQVDQLSVLDEQVDVINRAFFAGFNQESCEDMEEVIRIVMISRFVERIADHAVDIGEHVRFLVTGL